MIYDEIYEFCKVRNQGSAFLNGANGYPPRFQFIINLVEKLIINYVIERFEHYRFPNNYFYNLYLPGESKKMVVAHHDILNSESDNANDNSASVINCLALKLLNPEINVAILDAEEPPCFGLGSDKLVKDIHFGFDFFKGINEVLNLELTGFGEIFCVGKLGSELELKISEKSGCLLTEVPFSDSNILMRGLIDSTVICLLPVIDGKPNYSHWHEIHSEADSVVKISVKDMKNFVEDFLIRFYLN